MKKFTTLLLAILMVLPAMAVNMTGGEVLYFRPGSDWSQANARFAAYFFGSGSTWVNAESIPFCKGVVDYQFTVPTGNWTNVIFVRFSPDEPSNDFNKKWNQTGDLTFDGSNNLYTVSGWDNGGWSKYTSPTVSLAGGINDWNTSKTPLSANGKVFTTTIENFSGEFKIFINGIWFGRGQENVNNGVSFELGTGDNMKWKGNTTKVKVVVDMTDPNKYPVLTITEWLPETVVADTYVLLPGTFETENCELYAVRFVNKNDASEYKMQGYLDEHVVYFDYKEAKKYTHMTFYVIENNEEYATPDSEYPEIKTANVLDFEKWEDFVIIKESKETTYKGEFFVYNLLVDDWAEVDPEVGTGVNRVEAANGIGYTYGVVSAEGAIEVYNVNGAVVARGNDTIDLRGLGRGVYIIRNGNQVRKVVR